LVLLAVVVGVAIAAGPGGGGGPPLDPRSPKPLGTKGLIEVLRSLGATVDVTRSAPGPSVDTALILADDLGSSRRRQVADWVRAGGTLLLTDPSSPLNPFEVGDTTDLAFGASARIDRRCDLPALRDVERISAPGGAVMDAPSGATGCFRRNGGYWLVAAAEGRGVLVVVGGAGAFVNHRLDEADNIVLLAAVLAPRADSHVAVLQPPPPGSGRSSLWDLIGRRVKLALWQLVVAFVVLALWRARRLGRPVVEDPVVPLAGSELVVAVGNLLQRAGSRHQAAALLRADLHRELADWLGLPPTTTADVVADAAVAAPGAGRDRLLRALAGPPPATDADLVELAQLVAAVRREVLELEVARA
jgi:hypothetical protein